MAKGREIKLPLPAADDLFSTQEERDEATLIYLICVLRYTINRIGKIRQNKIRYKGIMTDTLPSIFPPI